jgi:2-polyprenyl-3-methyl-5-hydroxy-6-metoxy-1,4-benzoquinol methylase
MWQSKRSLEPEILDLGPDHYTSEEYDRCLKLLSRVNHLLGGYRATRNAFRDAEIQPRSILEVGCGGGYQCQQMHQWFPHANIRGIDISLQAINHAHNHLPQSMSHAIDFHHQPAKKLDFPENSCDVVTTTLVCHHMADEELIAFLQESYRVAASAVIINDLHRHWAAYASFALIAPLVFPHRLIQHDGLLSIKRAFRKKDWLRLLEKAGFKNHQYTLKWHWAFRWTVTLIK